VLIRLARSADDGPVDEVNANACRNDKYVKQFVVAADARPNTGPLAHKDDDAKELKGDDDPVEDEF